MLRPSGGVARTPKGGGGQGGPTDGPKWTPAGGLAG